MNFTILILTGILSGVGAGILITFYRKKSGKTISEFEETNTSFLFSGNLKQTSIVDAVQFLEIGKREGVLHIYCGRRKGYITFSKGKVIDAFYRDKTARDAMYEMMALDEGDFYFESRKIEQPRLTSDSIMDIVMGLDTAPENESNFLNSDL